MDLYFSPLACSLATRIALYEAGVEARYIEVDAKTKQTSDGEAFRDVHPLALVPVLRTDHGELLTENAAILQYVADHHPAAQLAPAPTDRERSRLHEWLCFIGMELHKPLFVPLLDPTAHDAVKAYALDKYRSRLDHLERRLSGRESLLERFSIADGYLFAVINWCMVIAPLALAQWPAVHAYHQGLQRRPSIARAFAEELALYQRALAR
jgi:glutathione S-transferase